MRQTPIYEENQDLFLNSDDLLSSNSSIVEGNVSVSVLGCVSTAHTYCAEQTHHKSYVFASHTLSLLFREVLAPFLPSKRANFIRIKPIS